MAGITMEKYLEDEGQTVEEFEADLDRRVRDAVAAQFILDEIAKKEELGVDQNELSEHLVRRAQQSGQDPQEFANHMFEHNHIPDLVQEILRGKALATIVESAVVKDASGNVVELKNLRPDGTIGEPEPRRGGRHRRVRRRAGDEAAGARTRRPRPERLADRPTGTQPGTARDAMRPGPCGQLSGQSSTDPYAGGMTTSTGPPARPTPDPACSTPSRCWPRWPTSWSCGRRATPTSRWPTGSTASVRRHDRRRLRAARGGAPRHRLGGVRRPRARPAGRLAGAWTRVAATGRGPAAGGPRPRAGSSARRSTA